MNKHEKEVVKAQLMSEIDSLSDEEKSILQSQIYQISRGIASSASYHDMAAWIRHDTKVSVGKSMRIVRTEGNRVYNAATLDCGKGAKERGCDLVKVWDSTLDMKTRPTHRECDGQVKELNEDFKNANGEAKAPGQFGIASEDINCRCAVLIKPRWDVDSRFTKRDNETKELKEFENVKSYKEFKERYWEAEKNSSENTPKSIDFGGGSGIIGVEGNIIKESNKMNNGESISAQSVLNKKKTDNIIKRGIELKRPIFADGDFGKYAHHIPSEDNYYDVAVHGTTKTVEFFGEPIDDRTLAEIIKKRDDYFGTDIRLLSCNTANVDDTGDCFAKRLAKTMGVNVKAPTKTLWVYPPDKKGISHFTVGTTVVSNDGEFVTFTPKGEIV